jgi:hypothetical protein
MDYYLVRGRYRYYFEELQKEEFGTNNGSLL